MRVPCYPLRLVHFRAISPRIGVDRRSPFGHTYVGWNTSADGSGTTYVANDAESGEVPADSNEYHAGDTVPVLGNSGGLTKAGYQFSGWEDANQNVYSEGESFTMGSSEVTLSAVWDATSLVGYYRVNSTGQPVEIASYTYVEGSVVSVKSDSEVNGGDPLVNLAEPFSGVPNYGFIYWSTAREDVVGDIYVPGEATITVEANDVELYAKFIGDRGPAGGSVFYDDEDDGNDNIPDARFLEASPDQVVMQWDPRPSHVWVGTESEIGKGQSNTNAIVGTLNDPEFHYPETTAALACNGYELESTSPSLGTVTYTDWYMPSMDELALIDYRLYQKNVKGIIITDGDFFSSTEASNDDAVAFTFGSGNAVYYDKSDASVHIIAVRSF